MTARQWRQIGLILSVLLNYSVQMLIGIVPFCGAVSTNLKPLVFLFLQAICHANVSYC